MGDKEHYVHFSSASGAGCNNIVVQPLRHGHLNVNLGFLQIHHRYHVEFTVPWNTCVIHPEGNPAAPAMPTGEPNSNCRVIGFNQDRDDLRLKVELFVHTERFLKEEFQITCCEKGAPLTIYLNARIFGKDQGTPVLRNGIRSIGVEDDAEEDEEEDNSD
ncbi:UPF0687 protein C20orf27 homolog [Nasonia vitripennis]|uniref:Adipose-secreted signaling protein n=1 Tax=Nasonia vitripennis TaxID=7425 RepID=A0A7M7GFK2_NASVI|nr:UPF0687 protein C20orf27 homolog [Nasonia vitripennis]